MKRYIYKKYQSSHPCHSHGQILDSISLNYFKANFQKLLPKDNNARILDIGCGSGHFLKYIDLLGYSDYLGVDISEEQINYCKRYVTNKVLLNSDLNKFLNSKAGVYDFIMINDVIEHFEKDEILSILSSVYKSLKKNGRVIIKTANLKSRWGASVRFMDFTHTIGFTEESLKQVLYLSGFKKINIVREIHPIHDVKSFLRIILKFFLEIQYRIEYLASFGGLHVNISNMLIAVSDK